MVYRFTEIYTFAVLFRFLVTYSKIHLGTNQYTFEKLEEMQFLWPKKEKENRSFDIGSSNTNNTEGNFFHVFMPAWFTTHAVDISYSCCMQINHFTISRKKERNSRIHTTKMAILAVRKIYWGVLLIGGDF